MSKHDEPERCPGVCPICLRRSTYRSGPQQWDCMSRRCNSQFYVDNEGLLNVRDRIAKNPVVAAIDRRQFSFRTVFAATFTACVVLATLIYFAIKG
jgi:hypothetical protein